MASLIPRIIHAELRRWTGGEKLELFQEAERLTCCYAVR